MSRHRIVRTMDYDEERYGYDDIYGHSVDDDSCISPTDAQQWLYDRAKGHHSISAFLQDNTVKEVEDEISDGDDDDDDDVVAVGKNRRDSENFQMPLLDDIEQAQLNSCIDEVRNVVGDSISERRLVETSRKFNYDLNKILNELLNEECNMIKNKKHDATAAITAEAVAAAVTATNIIKLSAMTNPNKSVLSSKLITQNLHSKANAPNSSSVIKVKGSRTDAKRGFQLNSPTPQISPNNSGRSTPSDLDDDMNKTKIGVDSISIAGNFKVSKEQAQRNALELFKEERGKRKPHLNMIVIGHVDAGKSTLMGHLLYDTGNVSQRTIHKYEQESKKIGKQSFMFAWVLDETGEERARGITMDVGNFSFQTDSKAVTLIDSPGHKDFIPNMISGATQADVALLVVDATRGEFESGFESGGQTREHAVLVRSLGIQQLAVVVNKLDTVGWSKDRFDEINQKLRSFLKQVGYKENDVIYVPCSGLTGENLAKPATATALTSWYSGPSVLQVIDNFQVPQRAVEKSFRLSISDIFKGTGAGFCIAGRIETGMLAVNDKVLLGANREQGLIKSILIDEISQSYAFAGDQVVLTLSGIDLNNISVGNIIYDPQNPIPIGIRFEARILIFTIKMPITKGYPVLLHHQSLIEPAIINKLLTQINKSTGQTIKRKPRCLASHSCALIEVKTTRPICIERYSDCKVLGRIMLRVSGVTIAAGIITQIYGN